LEKLSRNQRIPTIVAFTSVNNTLSRARQELLHRSRHSRTGLIHQGFDFDPARKCGFFGRAHLRCAHDRRIQSVLRLLFPALLFRSVIAT
jgi:hypothetical protein